MSNRSDKFIEILMGLVLLYSRVFGICNYNYDFEKNKLTYPRGLVIYTIIVNVILIVLLPISLYTQFEIRADQFRNMAIAVEVQKMISIASAVAICSSLIGQWTNPTKFRILFKQLTAVRVKECSNLKRNPRAIKKMTALFLIKLLLSILFVFGTFATIYLQNTKPSITHTVTSVYFAVVENLIIIVENQFYIGLLYAGYLFELLNDRIVEVVQEILVLDAKRSKRKHLGVLMQHCCTLSDELEVIGKMHTDVHDLAVTIKDLYEFQILTILLTVFTTQLLLCFYAIVYLSKNKMQMPMESFYLGVVGLFLSIGNLWLLIYVCGAVVYQSDLGGEHLKLLSSVQSLDSRLEKSIELLSFQLMREKMRLSLCGLMDINWTTGYMMMRACAVNLVLLVQLDYKNL